MALHSTTTDNFCSTAQKVACKTKLHVLQTNVHESTQPSCTLDSWIGKRGLLNGMWGEIMSSVMMGRGKYGLHYSDDGQQQDWRNRLRNVTFLKKQRNKTLLSSTSFTLHDHLSIKIEKRGRKLGMLSTAKHYANGITVSCICSLHKIVSRS